jgi:putative transposase
MWVHNLTAAAFIGGRRFRVLSVVDDFTRECLALVADISLPGLRGSCASKMSSSRF